MRVLIFAAAGKLYRTLVYEQTQARYAKKANEKVRFASLAPLDPICPFLHPFGPLVCP